MQNHILRGEIPSGMAKVIIGMSQILNNHNPLPGLKPAMPPYNIETLDVNKYRITVSVPGFEKSDLEVRLAEEVLTVSGKGAQAKQSSGVTYRGIFNADFDFKLPLAPYIKVGEISLINGLLNIDLNREIPDELKERTFEIN